MNSTKLTWEEAVLKFRSNPNNEELVQACFFDDPILKSAQRYYKSSEWRAVQDIIKDLEGYALDIGAGRGIASYALTKDGWKVFALEPDSSDIVGSGCISKLTCDANLDIKIITEFGEQLPFDNNFFELVHVRQVLHHAKDLALLCKEIHRVLKPGGKVIATREHVISNKKDLSDFLRNHPLHDLYGGEHAYLLQEYKNAFTNAGIKLISTYGPYDSDINLYPETKDIIIEKVERKLHFKLPAMLKPPVLKILSKMNGTAGRLYSFVGIK